METSAIIHNGALVNHVLPYSVLKPANVNGTIEIIKLACLNVLKPLYFISSMSVFADYHSVAMETYRLSDNDLIQNRAGYGFVVQK